MTHLWNDQRGGIITTELVLVLSLVSAGVISGLASVRNSVVSEAQDIARVVNTFNQSYGVSTVRGPSAYTRGSQFVDRSDIDLVTYEMSGIHFDGILE